jgi:hypothetical protein
MSELTDICGSIEAEKKRLRSEFEKGTTCKCCGQTVKLYKRKLNSSMAYGLIIIYKIHQSIGFDKAVKMNREVAKLKIPSSNIEYAKLSHWGLIEEQESDSTKKNKSGYWKITKRGIDFVINGTSIPKYVFIYNGKTQGRSDETVLISESLGDKFDYKELMSA